jgi:hypothetical protein
MHEARCLDSSSEISVSSSSILYPAGRSESKWFLSRPSKAEDRERENFPVPNLKHWIKHCQGARFQWSSISTRIYSRTVPLSNYLIRTLGTSPLVEFVARCLLPCVRFRWGVRGQKLWRSNSVAVSCGVARWGSLGRVHVGLVCVNVMYSKAYNLPSPQRANIYIYRPWESLTVRRQYVVFQPHCSQDLLGLLLFVAANAYYEYAYIYSYAKYTVQQETQRYPISMCGLFSQSTKRHTLMTLFDVVSFSSCQVIGLHWRSAVLTK